MGKNPASGGVADRWNQIGKPFLPGFFGVDVIEAGPDGVVCQIVVRPELLAPNGYLHAAAVIGLADTACGYGCMGRLPEGAGGFTTVELKCNFTGTARQGVLTCRATPVHLGRLTQVWDAVVTAEETGKVLSHFRCTQMMLYGTLSEGGR